MPVELSYAFGEPAISGRIRSHPEDFKVDEISAVTPDGEGEHMLLLVRKTGANTDWVAARLAEAFDASRRDVSYAGRKDRHAITTQWFSVLQTAQEAADWQTRLPHNIEILESHRHRRKLRRGTLAGNRFAIVLRDLAGDVATLESRVHHIKAEGVPNYFGEQRFGRDGSNLAAAQQMFSGKRARLPRNRREMLLSAARSYIFNAVLARRVADATWNQLVTGDVAGLAGSQSIFKVDDIDETLRLRAASHDIHPTGPLWGRGLPASTGAILELETQLAERHKELARGLEKAGLAQSRRPLRLSVPDLQIEFADDAAELRFTLQPGSYATVVLRELLNYDDASIADNQSQR